jgi:hypothetical protein
VNKIEYSVLLFYHFRFTCFLALLGPVIFPVLKKAKHNLSNSVAPVNGYASLFLCPLNVSNIALATNLIAFYSAGWTESVLFLRNGNPDFWRDRIPRKVKTMEVD